MENLMALKSRKHRNFSFESPTVIEQVAYSIQAPLGTMDSDQVANIRASVIGFIEKGNGYSVDQADRLIQRLAYEYASGSKLLRRDTNSIVDLHVLVFSAWMKLGMNEAALNRAEAIVKRLGEWSLNGRTNEPLLPLCLNLLQSLTDKNTDSSIYQAAQLLIWWTDRCSVDEHVVPHFQTLLAAGANTGQVEVCIQLIDRMECLHSEHGWDDIRPSAELRSALLKTVVLENPIDSPCTEKHQDSPTSALPLDRIQTILQVAGRGDWERIEGLLHRVRSDQSLSPQLATYFLDYAITTKDPTICLAVFGQLITDHHLEKEINVSCFLERILKLSATRSDTTVPTLAQDLVLSLGRKLPMKTFWYNLLCLSWIRNTLNPDKAVQALVDRMKQSRPSTNSMTQGMLLLSSEKDSSAFAPFVLGCWKQLDESDKELILMVLPDLIARQNIERSTLDLMKQLSKDGFNLAPMAMADSFKTHFNRKPEIAVLILDELESIPVLRVPMLTYRAAMDAVMNSNSGKRGETFEDERKIILKVVKRASQNKGSTADVIVFLEQTFCTLAASRRARAAERHLRLLEHESSTHLLSVASFNHVIKAHCQHGNAQAASQTLDRLLEYYKSGQMHLRPNKLSFSLCLGTQQTGVVKKDIFFKMLSAYELHPSDEYKPDADHLNKVLLTWSDEGQHSTELATDAKTFLDAAIKRGVLANIISFRIVIQKTLKDGNGAKFPRALAITKRMKETLGPETSDPIICNMTLNACAHAMDDEIEPALQTLMEVMGELCRSGNSDEVSYTTFVKALKHLLPKNMAERDRLLEPVFLQCTKDKLYNDKIARVFKSGFTRESWNRVKIRKSQQTGLESPKRNGFKQESESDERLSV
jgi:hypothetical protein